MLSAADIIYKEGGGIKAELGGGGSCPHATRFLPPKLGSREIKIKLEIAASRETLHSTRHINRPSALLSDPSTLVTPTGGESLPATASSNGDSRTISSRNACTNMPQHCA